MGPDADALAAAGHQDLIDSLQQVPRFVEQWWHQNYLPWFTDHGPTHSRRVAEYALQLARIPDLPARSALTPLETFVLWSAAWLHDLGMQSLLGEKLGEISPRGYDRVRHEHPQRSADVILERSKEIGLPEDTVLNEVIALVARAHGTRYYVETVRELRQLTFLRNEPVRPHLLASLLLLADELDLDYRRVPNLPGAPVLNDVSIAHSTKHKCIVACGVEHRGAGAVGMSVRFLMAHGTPSPQLLEIEKWVVEKLRVQIALVESEFLEGFGGHAKLDRRIAVSYQPSQQGSPAMTSDALRVVESENRRSELINHDRTMARIEEELASRANIWIFGRVEGSDSSVGTVDVDGREDLFEVALLRQERAGTKVLSSTCLFESLGAANLRDVLVDLLHGLDAEVRDEDDRDQILQRMVNLLEESSSTWIAGISSLDLLGSDEQAWIEDVLIPSLREASDICFIATFSPGTSAFARLGVGVDANGLDTEQVRSYLARYAPLATATAEATLGLRYSKYKALKQNHLATMLGG